MRSVIVPVSKSKFEGLTPAALRLSSRPCPKTPVASAAEDRCGDDLVRAQAIRFAGFHRLVFSGGSQPGDRAVRSLTAAFDWIGRTRSARPARCRCLFSNPDLWTAGRDQKSPLR